MRREAHTNSKSEGNTVEGVHPESCQEGCKHCRQTSSNDGPIGEHQRIDFGVVGDQAKMASFSSMFIPPVERNEPAEDSRQQVDHTEDHNQVLGLRLVDTGLPRQCTYTSLI